MTAFEEIRPMLEVDGFMFAERHPGMREIGFVDPNGDVLVFVRAI